MMRYGAIARGGVLAGALLSAILSLGTVGAQEAVLLHLNDFHGQVLPRGDSPGAGGIRALAHAVAAERTRAGADSVLLLDGGDWFQGTPEGNVPRGRMVVDLYSALKLDVAVVGNHEFDFGEDNLKELIDRASFAVVGANVLRSAGGEVRPYLKPYVIREVGGIRFGIIGILTPKTPRIVRKDVGETLVVDEVAATVQRWIPKVRAAGAECIVVLSHLGVDGERALAEAVDGIDIIVGGHSHTAVEVPWVGPRYGTVVVQAGSSSRYLGRLTVKRLAGGGFEIAGGLQPLVGRLDSGIPAIEKILAEQLPPVQGEMQEEVGLAAELLQGPDRRARIPNSSDLGYWLSKVMADAAGTDIGIHNTGGIRDVLRRGSVTRRDLFQVSPFGNLVAICSLRGSTLQRLFERALGEPGRPSGLEAYGVEVIWDRIGDRRLLRELRIGGEPVDPAAVYRVATNDFIAAGQDGWVEFLEFGAPELLDVDIYEASVAALRVMEEPLRRSRRQVYRRGVTDEVVGRSERALSPPPAKPRFPISSASGSWLCEVMAKTADTPIAFQLTVDIEAGLGKGDLTRRDLYALAPFGAGLVRMNLTGTQLDQIIRGAVAPPVEEDGSFGQGPASLEFSGVTIEWRRDGDGRVVDRVSIGDAPLDTAAIYAVATTDYLAAGGGGFSVLADLEAEVLGVRVYDALVAEVSRLAAAGETVAPVAEAYRQTGSWAERGTGLLGLLALVSIAWLLSTNRRAIKLRPVVWGLGLQFCLAFLILETRWGQQLFVAAKNLFIKVMDFSIQGSAMVFGPLSSSALVGEAFGGWDFIFFTQILGTIVLVSTLMAILYHIGIMQVIVFCFAKVMQLTMGTSGAESLASAANVFVGQTEAPLVIRPYLLGLTSSEIMSMMTGGMATVAGGVLAAYVGFGIDAGHLLAASVMSAPAALAVAKILVPATKESATSGRVPFEVNRTDSNVIDATCRGASEGFKLALNVMAMLIAVVALVHLLNYGLDQVYHFAVPQSSIDSGSMPTTVSLQWFLGKVFQPLAWLLGIPWSEADKVGGLLGTRMVLNEFLAYMDLAAIAGELSPRSAIITTYALCGFANFSSIAIQIGGISGLEEGLRPRLAKLGFISMIGGTLATLMTACIAGVFL